MTQRQHVRLLAAFALFWAIVIMAVSWASYRADLDCKQLGYADGGWYLGQTYCRTYHHLSGNPANTTRGGR